MGIFSIALVSAEFWACFDKGDIVKYCNGYKPDFTCNLKNGCQKCISIYDESRDCFVHGVWMICMDGKQICANNNNENGTTEFDNKAPNATITNPKNKEIYGDKRIDFSGSADETATWTYRENTNPGNEWKSICRNKIDCTKTITFNEGFNNITVKITDAIGNSDYQTISFFIDSKKPKIIKTYPKNEFADGNFEVQFKEDNPMNLTLFYGNDKYKFNLSKCTDRKNSKICDVYLDLSKYNGQVIDYWFELEDIAGNKDESKVISIKVDTQAPVILNLAEFFSFDGKYGYFNIQIQEDNLDEAVYNYIDSKGRVREVKLCSSLDEGVCKKKKIFNGWGYENLTLIVRDEAGNSVGIPFSL